MEGINTYSPTCLIEAQLRARICDIEALVKGGVLKYLPTGQIGIMTTAIVPSDDVDRLHRRIDELSTSTIEGLGVLVDDQSDYINSLLSNCKCMNQIADELRADMLKRDTTIDELKNELNRYRSSDSANTIANLRRLNTLLHKQFREHYETIGDLEDTITENGVNAESTIGDLNISVKVKDNTIMCLNKNIDKITRDRDEWKQSSRDAGIVIRRLDDRKEDSKMLSKVIEIIGDDSLWDSEIADHIYEVVKDRVEEMF